MNVAIILAGGRGTRVGADVPKQFVEVLGRPVLSYTIERFQRHPEVDAIEVVCRPGWKSELKRICEDGDFNKVRWVAEGGATFQESVMSGLNHLDSKICDDDVVPGTICKPFCV